MAYWWRIEWRIGGVLGDVLVAYWWRIEWRIEWRIGGVLVAYWWRIGGVLVAY